jgi:DNA polymerase-3 subunit epsilon
MAYLVFDLEMTGEDPYWHDIIQLGGVLFDNNWNELGRYLTNIYPENDEGFSIPSAEIHGLTKAELKDAPMMHEVIPAFEDWVVKTLSKGQRLLPNDRERFLRQTTLCGQGVIGDLAFLREAYRREKQTWNFPYVPMDLQQFWLFLTRCLQYNGIKAPQSASLKAITEFFDMERETDIHNALEDSVLTAECLKKVLAYTKTLKLIEKA